MVLSQSVQQVVRSRSRSGASALDIAEELGLEFDEVYNLILHNLTSPQRLESEVRPSRAKQRSFTLHDLPQLLEPLFSPATEYGHRGTLWTVPRFVAIARPLCGIQISKRTIRRYQQKLG